MKLTTPVAIVIAGILIAAAVIYSNSLSTPSPGNNQGGTAPVAEAKTIEDFARAAGVGNDQFKACNSASQFDNKVQTGLDQALAAGAQGTPFSVVVAKNGEKFVIAGAYPYTDVKKTIETALAANGNTEGAAEVSIPEVTEQDHILGSINAPVKVVEYSDLQCPFCGRFHPTMQRVIQEFGDQVAWVYRHFPLESIHPNARPLANAAECAASVGGNEAFWKFVDAVFAAQ